MSRTAFATALAIAVIAAGRRTPSRSRISIAARPSPSWSASPPAAATTSTRACSAATSAGTFPAIRGGGAEHAGRRLAQGHAIRLRRRTQGRHRARDRQPRHGDRPAAQRRQVRRHQAHLDRQRHQRDQHLRDLEDVADQDLGRHVQARVHARRQRGRRRSGHLRADPAQRVRRQGQARHRLPGRQRHQPRHGARRGRRPLRLVVVEPQEPEELAAADQPAGAVRGGEERRVSNAPWTIERAANDEQRQVLRLLTAGQFLGRPFFCDAGGSAPTARPRCARRSTPP